MQIFDMRVDFFIPVKRIIVVPHLSRKQGTLKPEFNKSGGPAGHQVRILWGLAEIYTVPVGMSPILSKYFLLPTSSMFRMFVGSIIFVPMFGLLSYY